MNVTTTAMTVTTVTTMTITGGGGDKNGIISTTIASLIGMNVAIPLDSSRTGVFESDVNISPVTLSADWSRVARLLLLASLAVIGSVGNVFMISAVMVEDHLKKRGIN